MTRILLTTRKSDPDPEKLLLSLVNRASFEMKGNVLKSTILES